MAKILIVDDSEVLRMELHDILEEAGHEVYEGENGNSGFATLLANPGIQLIITDLNMPGSDGMDLCRKVRSVSAFETLPIFVLTTESSMDLKALGKEVGVLLWIVKPFDGQKVRNAITKVLHLIS